MISLDNLSVHFGDICALDHFTGNFPAGKITALAGGDGAGKTTLLRTLASSAQRRKLGISLSARDVTYQAANGGVWNSLSVSENMRFVAQAYSMEPAAARSRTARLVKAAGLDEAANRQAAHLSGGMRQKLGVIMAMLPRPRVLLLDEPTTGVDFQSRRDMWQLMRQSALDATTVIASTTYLDEAENADSIILMDKGRVLGQGSPAQIISAAPGWMETWPAAGPAPDAAVDIDSAHVWQRAQTMYRWHEGEPPGAGEENATIIRPDDVELATIAYLLQAQGEDARPLAWTAYAYSGPAGEVLAQAKGVTKKFGSFKALDGVDLSVEPGEVVGLVGGNGAGKSTLIRIMLGLEQPTEGQVSLMGQKPGRQARKHVGYVPQSLGLYPTLTPRENLQFAADVFGVREGGSTDGMHWGRRGRGHSAPTGKMSLGQQRDLAVECALSHRPVLLMLDEPTSGMDALSRAQLWKMLRRTAQAGVGILVTTHYREEAYQCDRLVELRAGRVVAGAA